MSKVLESEYERLKMFGDALSVSQYIGGARKITVTVIL